MKINNILENAVKAGASDVHLSVGLKPLRRINGDLEVIDCEDIITSDNIDRLVNEIVLERKDYYERILKDKDMDIAYSIAGIGRFRVNIFMQRGSLAIAIRVVNTTIPKIEDLGLPESVNDLAGFANGLVLVTGPTGSGKSTTLASIIDKINRERSCHIITLEDPIEYTHKHIKSLVNQREIGSDASSFAAALRSSLRQDPDVILVGEMRDLETISIALTAAETGHLVFGTLHTNNSSQTVERIIDVFPAEQQGQVRTQLSSTLQAIVTQQLVPVVNELKRVPAAEVLFASPAIKNLIREGKTHQILSALQTSGKQGMQTMDASLRLLFQKGLISKEELHKRSSNNV